MRNTRCCRKESGTATAGRRIARKSDDVCRDCKIGRQFVDTRSECKRYGSNWTRGTGLEHEYGNKME